VTKLPGSFKTLKYMERPVLRLLPGINILDKMSRKV